MSGLPFTAEQAGLLGVLAAEVAFRDCDEWLDALLRQLDQNRGYLVEHLPAGIRWTPPQVTFMAWPDRRDLGLAGDPSEVFRREVRVALGLGLDYDPDAAGFRPARLRHRSRTADRAARPAARGRSQ